MCKFNNKNEVNIKLDKKIIDDKNDQIHTVIKNKEVMPSGITSCYRLYNLSLLFNTLDIVA